MGARLQVREARPSFWARREYSIDIHRDRRGEFFELRVPRGKPRGFEVLVPQVLPKERHLVLSVRTPDPKRRLATRTDCFLCGHDERAWLVAAIPGTPTNVGEAKQALKPAEVSEAERRVGLRPRETNRRRNRAFIRQGEWFFVPEPSLQVEPIHVLYREPIRRGRSKPHLVEELFRTGGIRVRVCAEYPNGLTDWNYRALLRNEPDAVHWTWVRMQREPRVFARGRVRHPDHATIILHGWHRVLMNTETEAASMGRLAFLD